MLPPWAAWRHVEARDGMEVVSFAVGDGVRASGMTTAVEAGATWAVSYEIEVDASWVTRRASVTSRCAGLVRTVVLEHDGEGRWLVDGAPAGLLDGCLDVDLESSALTNAFPVHRLGLTVAARADAPAAFVRAADVTVERLEQTYRRLDGWRYHYSAPVFDVACELRYDHDGLVADYPGLAERIA